MPKHRLIGGLGTQVGGPDAADRNYIVGLSIRSADPNVTQPFGVQVGSVGQYLVIIITSGATRPMPMWACVAKACAWRAISA